MGTKARTILLTAVYVGLAVCVTALVTTATIENFPHQVLGIAFFVLALCHLVLNRFWTCHAFLGTWEVRRAQRQGASRSAASDNQISSS